MYLIFLGMIGLLALVSLIDRSAVGFALIGLVVMLAMLIRKVRHLTNHVSSLEIQISGLDDRSQTEQARVRPEPETDRAPVPTAASGSVEASVTREAPPQQPGVPASSETRSDPKAPAKPPAEEAVEKTAREVPPVVEPTASAAAEPFTPAAAAARSMPEATAVRRVATTAQPVAKAPTDSQRRSPGRAPPPPNWFDRLLRKATEAAWAWITSRVATTAQPVATAESAATAEPVATAPTDSQSGSPGRAPPPPNWFDRLLRKGTEAAWAWITGGNVFVRVGILILFMGMTFLIRFAIGQNMIPIELRLAIVAAVAVALLVWGWRQREKKQNFALVVQGGGIGLLYLTIFASFSLYRVLDSTPAFVMLGVIVILAAILAVQQNAKSLALFAAVGGFLAPILTSSGSNNYIGLFSYYTLLNIGIFAVAWFKSWRILNLTGFVFTFAISGIWGVLSYRPEYFDSTQPFLIIFFLLYVGISILFALRRSINFKDSIDSSLVFGTPLLAFGMQCELVGDYEYGIAISAFSLAAFYLCTSLVLWRMFSTRLRLLCETFVSLAVIFATLAIPFAIDGSLTGPIWAIEGAGILWVSIRQQQFYRRLFAVLLMLAAGAIIGWEIIFTSGALFLEKSAFANSAFIGTTLIAISAAVASYLLAPAFDGKRDIESKIEYGLLAYSTVVLLVGFEVQIFEFDLFRAHPHLLAFLSVVAGLSYVIAADQLKWAKANGMSLGFFALLIPAAGLSFVAQYRLSEHHGYLLWPVAMIAWFYGLSKVRQVLKPFLSAAIHLIAAGLLALLLFWEGIWQLLLGYSLLCVIFCKLGERNDWRELRRCGVLFLPALVLCFVAAIGIDGNLVDLSSIGSEYYPPMPPGGILWPLAFATYFYLLLKNPGIGGRLLVYFYLGAAFLIAAMLLWLGLWPLLLGATVLCWLAYYLAHRLQWGEMRLLSKLLFPLMIIVPIVGLANGMVDPVKLITFNLDYQLATRSGFFLWPFAFVTLYLIYWLSEKEKQPPSAAVHAMSCLFLVAMATWEISRLGLNLVAFKNAWHLVLLPIVGLFAIKSILMARHWPFNRYQQGFDRYALLPLAFGTILWSLLQFTASARSDPLIWIPLLNPLDLMQCLILYGWFANGSDKLNPLFGVSRKQVGFVLAGFIFLWINVDILRFVHHWAGVSWDFDRLIQADLTQTLMSLVWSVLGLGGTFYAARIKHRQLWIISAVLLAVVVLKLFVIDLSAQDTIERIVSFTGVGLLLTFVGYFSPIPPRSDSGEDASVTGKA